MRSPKSLVRACLLLATCVALTSGALAAGFDDFSLAKAIPADATIAWNSRDHAGQAFINKQCDRICEAVQNAHFDRDLRKLLRTSLEGQDTNLDEFDAQWQQVSDLITAVDWSSLAKHEMAFALRFPKVTKGSADLPVPEFVILSKPAPEKAGECYEALTAMLKSLQKLADQSGGGLTLTDDKQGDLQTHKLSFPPPMPVGLTLARYKDTIVIGFGSSWIEQSLSLLAKPGASIVSNDRFKAAFKSLPTPTDSFSFVDVARVMEWARSMAGMAETAGGPEGKEISKALTKAIDLFDMYETMGEVATTDGLKCTSDSLTVLRAGGEKSSLYSALYAQPALGDVLKYVPKTAQSVHAGSGMDLAKAYDVATAFMKEVAPEGEDPTAQLEAVEAQLGFKIKDDILGWAQGSYCTFSIPGPQAFSQAESVMMFRVRDEKKATDFVDRVFAAVEPMLQSQNGTTEEIEIDGAKFRSIMQPMLAMVGGLSKPTIGVKDGYLFFGSSPKGLKEALAVASGKSENFTKSERFVASGISLDKPLHSIEFEDLTNWGQSVGQGMQMATQMLPLASGGAIKLPQPVSTLISKVGSIMNKIDFYSLSVETGRFDGREYTTHRVITYREPPAGKADTKKADDGEAKSKSGSESATKTAH